MTRPALIEAATKRVLDIRQLFEDAFRWLATAHKCSVGALTIIRGKRSEYLEVTATRF